MKCRTRLEVVVQASEIIIPIDLQPNVEFNEFQFKFLSFPLGLHEPQ